MMDNHYTVQKLHELREIELEKRIRSGEFVVSEAELDRRRPAGRSIRAAAQAMLRLMKPAGRQAKGRPGR
ncbi:hypothetical protein ACFSL6_20435 [Paenibacillus thailandensis]|uniref:Uncharacterized protein n=1 Tax=Paenibacillus thailandensis TaxID=393250 RepID=A0ABW5R187_9BACL